jgi:23S rRNA (adenine2503-C2)-methyltransferase
MKHGIDIRSLDAPTLAAQIGEMGQPSFRATQLFQWLHEKRAVQFGDMTNLPEDFKQRLAQRYEITQLEVLRQQTAPDDTMKYLFGLSDKNSIETVVMRYAPGASVCISTQVGCAMGCRFCASTEGGRVRNLTPEEMLAQVYQAGQLLRERVHAVVLMGIGEPLDNFDNVMRFVDIITHPQGYNLAGRALTISTCGIVPKIYALADQKRQLTLSVSLHAATNAKRSAVMPINKTYPLEQLIPACRYYFEKTGRRVTYEYAVMHKQNDQRQDVRELLALLGTKGTHINLIPVNPVMGHDYSASRQQAADFRAQLQAAGRNATVRRTLGQDIDAACGQLRREHK